MVHILVLGSTSEVYTSLGSLEISVIDTRIWGESGRTPARTPNPDLFTASTEEPKFILLNKIVYNPSMADFDASLYEVLGGEMGLRSLVDRFYDLMDSSPEAEKIRSFHGKSLRQSREKLFMFLSGWSGGPQLYLERFGHPRLRMRHMPFAIGVVERDQWLWCMNRALDESGLEPPVVESLKNHFAQAADFMRNQAEG